MFKTFNMRFREQHDLTEQWGVTHIKIKNDENATIFAWREFNWFTKNLDI